MYKRKDSFYKKAKEEGYKSRAAYKLKEINSKFKLVKKGDTVVDAGAAPGGWSQVLLELVGKQGHVVAVDRLDITGIKNLNFTFIKGDLFDENTLSQILNVNPKYDIVISDAAPNTSGQKFADHANSLALVEKIFQFSKNVLKDNGNFLAKLFDGEDTKGFVGRLGERFQQVSIYRPKSTRKNSFEIYIVCKGFNNDK